MHTIAIVSRKGGAGKTTVAVHLAAAAEQAGRRAAILDVDPQASASAWSDRREADRPEVPCLPRSAPLSHSGGRVLLRPRRNRHRASRRGRRPGRRPSRRHRPDPVPPGLFRPDFHRRRARYRPPRRHPGLRGPQRHTRRAAAPPTRPAKRSPAGGSKCSPRPWASARTSCTHSPSASPRENSRHAAKQPRKSALSTPPSTPASIPSISPTPGADHGTPQP